VPIQILDATARIFIIDTCSTTKGVLKMANGNIAPQFHA
jgi:hypothetical protein